MPRSSIIILILASACAEDPILARADRAASDAPPGGAPAGGEGPVKAEPPAPGTPDPPPPGVPSDPPPGAAGPPGGAFAVNGPTVPLSGEVRYATWARGTIRIDVFDGDQRDFSAHPSVVLMHRLDRPGPFTIEVPAAAGRVWLSAFADENGNGFPDPGDPTGFLAENPVALDAGAREGLVIELGLRPKPEPR